MHETVDVTDVDPLRSGIAVVVLVAIAVLAARVGRVSISRDVVVATVRAAVQLAAVAVVIAWVFRHPEGTAVYLGVMVVAAAVTASRRIGLSGTAALGTAVAIVAGALAAVVPVLASGALELGAQTVLPFTAQIIGGAMTATSLAGLRLRDEAVQDWGQVEAWLSIGATPRQALAPSVRVAVSRAIFPATDQTRSAGLVTLPGAFVGLLLGGASPAEAAEVQLLVLVGLLAAEAVAAVVVTRLLAPGFGRVRPETVPR